MCTGKWRLVVACSLAAVIGRTYSAGKVFDHETTTRNDHKITQLCRLLTVLITTNYTINT